MLGAAMKRLLPIRIALAGCGGGTAPVTPPLPETKPMPTSPPAPQAAEPERITVQHILISFAGTRTEATRSKAEAEKLAAEVLARVKKGEDFGKLVKELSDDPGEGIYAMCNHDVKMPREGEYPRKGMVAAFGDVGFKLAVGEVGMSAHDPKASPFGWHIIKRLK